MLIPLTDRHGKTIHVNIYAIEIVKKSDIDGCTFIGFRGGDSINVTQPLNQVTVLVNQRARRTKDEGE